MTNKVILSVLFCLPLAINGASIVMAPQRCPLQNGNLLDVDLFVPSEADCVDKCSTHDKCFFYFFYKGMSENSSPSQCFLYETCDREVQPTPEDCPLGKDNVIGVMAFIKTADECMMTCSHNSMCSYYKYFSKDDERQPMLCYHLRSCVPKLVKRSKCPLEKNNYIDHKLFVQSDRQCLATCQETPDCRFYYWYPIDYSPKPLYCYLFRSCLTGAEEPLSAIIAGGRHPGEYFLTGGESIDVLKNNKVCNTAVMPNTTLLGRGGAVSDFVGGSVLVCGGKDTDGSVRADCLAYATSDNTWKEHSTLGSAREEAAAAVVGDVMFVMGGIIQGEETPTASMEIWNGKQENPQWRAGKDMPEARARFCAALRIVDGRNDQYITIIGGENDGNVLSTMKTLGPLDADAPEWTDEASMKTARKDHACAYFTMDDDAGILVTGGVDVDNQPLASVEFYSFKAQEWVELGNMKTARTEHGLAIISGIPTVIGGVASTEFLASVEQLDNSKDRDAPRQREWRIVSQALSAPRYDFSLSHIPTRLVSDEVCMEKPMT